MRVLVIGGGGREHCLAWKIAQSERVDEVLVAPGNGGTARYGENITLKSDDIEGLVDLARKKSVGLVVVGPEAPLTAGIVDELTKQGIPAFGPSGYAARLEGSKEFSKKVMRDSGIATAQFESFTDFELAERYLRAQYQNGKEMVIKADGLAAGKGVLIPENLHEALAGLHQVMVERLVGDAGHKVVLEEKLVGEEVSILALSDGETVIPLLPSQDHKRVGEGDSGPNTGGMGAYCPVPKFGPSFVQQVQETVLEPTIRTMAEMGHPYKGVLYAGLMVCDGKPYVLEFNVRFGDPETQVVLPMMGSDLVELAFACIEGDLAEKTIEWRKGAAMTVVAASKGYPGAYPKGEIIRGVSDAEALEDILVFQAGTVLQDNVLKTSGGRVLNVVGLGSDLNSAAERAYEGLSKIQFEGMHYRRDIGWRAL